MGWLSDAVDHITGVDPLKGVDLYDPLENLKNRYKYLKEQEVFKIGTGREFKDRKKLAEKSSAYEGAVDRYNAEMDAYAERQQSMFMFPEIFGMAIANLSTEYSDGVVKELEVLKAEIDRLYREYNEAYSTLNKLADMGDLGKILAGGIRGLFGIADTGIDILEGKASPEEIKTYTTTVLKIVVIIVAIYTEQWWAVGILIGDFIVYLDGTYGDGSMTVVIVGLLDFFFNDILHTSHQFFPLILL